MRYLYTAIDIEGKKTKGVLNAGSPIDAVGLLKSRSLKIIELEEDQGILERRDERSGNSSPLLDLNKLLRSRRKLNKNEYIEEFTHQMAMFSRGGVPMAKALELMRTAETDNLNAQVLNDIEKRIRSGEKLSDSFSHAGFDDCVFFIGMLRAGETSGNLAGAFASIYEYYKKRREARTKIISALIYPAILGFVALSSIVMMFGFVLPQFEELFSGMRQKLPLLTVVTMDISAFLRSYADIIFIIVIAIYFSMPKLYKKSNWRDIINSGLRNSLFYRSVEREYVGSLLLGAFSKLLRAGIPVATAFEGAVATIENKYYRSAFEAVGQDLREGKRLSYALSRVNHFDKKTIGFIQTGEETGTLGSICEQLGDMLGERYDIGVNRFIQLVEPILIVILGLFVGLIITAILMGILSVNEFIS